VAEHNHREGISKNNPQNTGKQQQETTEKYQNGTATCYYKLIISISIQEVLPERITRSTSSPPPHQATSKRHGSKNERTNATRNK